MAEVPELRDDSAGIGAQVGANALAPGPWGSLHPSEGRFLQNVLQPPLPPGAPAGSARGARRTVVPGERRLLVLL